MRVNGLLCATKLLNTIRKHLPTSWQQDLKMESHYVNLTEIGVYKNNQL